jgi:hypothetical protein
MTLPTFVVIGAMKAGTVSLSHYLDEHPDVFIGRGGTAAAGGRLADSGARMHEIIPNYAQRPAGIP